LIKLRAMKSVCPNKSRYRSLMPIINHLSLSVMWS
jgi:hypothetical protein